MTYDEAMSFWFGRINFEVRSAAPDDLKLERMRALLRLLGNPQDRLRIVHIAGTKGKGSTAAMLDAVLRAAGYRVGLFTSPHLVHVEERVQVDRVMITPEELAARMGEIAAAVRELDRGPFPPPTFFEIGTALGYLHFVCRRVDAAIVEVGLGGRFDSTNVCRPMVSVITSIGLDHTAQLGHTHAAIAFQKAGIIKRRVPVVSGATRADVCRVIEQEAARNHAPLRQVDRAYPGPIRLLGDHQAWNAAVSVAVVDELRRAGMAIPPPAIGRGLADVRWPARVEIVARKPTVVLDTAHNVPSAEALIAALRSGVPTTGRKIAVFAVSSDKPYADILGILAGYFDHFALCRYGANSRAVPPELLAAELAGASPGTSVAVYHSPAAAWSAARSAARDDDLICVTGSVFLAGELQTIVAQAVSGITSDK